MASDLADLPGHSVAITSTCTTKLERFDEIGTRGNRNFENEFSEMVFQILEEIISINEISCRIYRETTVEVTGAYARFLKRGCESLGCHVTFERQQL